jgi:hypothetical protein
MRKRSLVFDLIFGEVLNVFPKYSKVKGTVRFANEDIEAPEIPRFSNRIDASEKLSDWI